MLRAFVGDNREELIERCRSKSASRRSSRAAPELSYGVPQFLTLLADALPGGVSFTADTELRALQAAAKHGQELLQNGFTIEQVVHGYGDLCQAITELASERSADIPAEEFGILNIRLDNAIASAVAAYSHEHAITVAGESKHASNEQLAFLVTEMRNLLNTSTLAISAMKRGSVGFSGATGAALDRSMAGMRGLIDRSLAELRQDSGESPHVEIIEIGPFIAAVQLAAATEAANSECELTAVVEPDIFVEADRHVLGGAMSNLLHAAINNTARPGHIFLSARARTGRVIIDVEDSGPGAHTSALRDILSGFEERTSPTTALGSALLCSLQGVEASGGFLAAHAVAGNGCLYTIDLPEKAGPA